MPPESSEERARRTAVDYDALAEDLSALAYAARLELLDLLDAPRLLSEVRLRPRRGEEGANPARVAAKQTVAAHLDRLRESGLLATSEVERGGKRLTTYQTNPQRLYAVVEELRRLVVRRPGAAAQEVTGTLDPAAGARLPSGPRLVLVHGAYEGRGFPLAAPQEEWTIGRRRGLPVSLDYDPYVSAENSVVSRNGDTFLLRDLDSKNGTQVNWSPVEPGAPARLRHGDIVGVGRSLLVFYTS